MSEPNLLAQWNSELQSKILTSKAAVDARRAAAKRIPWNEYLLISLAERISSLLGLGSSDELDLSFVDSGKFKADIALRVPGLLKTKPTPQYIKDDVPRFAGLLEPLKSEGILEKIETKGIYLNLTVGDRVIFDAAEEILGHGEVFGLSDLFAARRQVVDYSSPNVAKHLHAGHVRSTIIGHVLSNMYDALGGTSYRLNYINDWGGFGELIEGYDRWKSVAPAGLKGNDLSFFIYSTFRSAEKGAADAKGFSELTPEQKANLERCFPGKAGSLQDLQAAFAEFKAVARARFANLEQGKEAEVTRWKEMVSWSLVEFEEFYSLLRIHHDFVVGESFYVARGKKIVEEGLAAGAILKFSEKDALEAKKAIAGAKEAKEITEEVETALCAEVDRDVGAYVVPLSKNKRMVVQRADGSTIYATRDLAGVKHRTETFGATDLVYEVGQEQGDHFSQLFEASKQLGLMGSAEVSCRHIFHGFYVDSTTKKKLSSRQGANSVLSLFKAAMEYFFKKYEENSEFSVDERRDIACKLAIGSVVYNDLRRDKKLPVELNPEQSKMIEEFERSGGAYVVYSVCRARSILRKAGVPSPRGSQLRSAALVPMERELMKMALDFPRRVAYAGRNDNPAALIGYIEELATAYNRYYHDCPVIKGGEQNFHRLSITEAVAIVLENGLRICHIECPARI